MSEVLIILVTMLVSFVLGAVGMLMFGGRMTLNYIQVKLSRGKKVLLFVRTPFGWRNFVAKKQQHTLLWKYDSKDMTTDIKSSGVSRFLGVSFVFVDSLKPVVAIELKEGSLYPADFDAEVFNNILIRALTRPEGKVDKMLKNLIIMCVFISIITMIMCIVILTKIPAAAVTGGVI